MTTVQQNKTLTDELEVGNKLTVAVSASGSGSFRRYQGSTLIETIALSAGITRYLGEYINDCNFAIDCFSGSIEVTESKSTGTVLPIVTDANGNVTGLVAPDGSMIGLTMLGVAQTFTAGQRGEVTELTDAVNITSDFNDSNFFSVTLAGNRTLDNPSNLVAGQSGSIWLIQDATGGRTLSLGSNFKTSLGSAIELTTTANAIDRLDYVVRSNGNVEVSITKDLK